MCYWAVAELGEVIDIFDMRNHNVDETSCFSRALAVERKKGPVDCCGVYPERKPFNTKLKYCHNESVRNITDF